MNKDKCPYCEKRKSDIENRPIKGGHMYSCKSCYDAAVSGKKITK